MTEPSPPPTPENPQDSSLFEPRLSMAAGSFLDLTAEKMIEVCRGTDDLGSFGLRVSGEHHFDRGRWAEMRAIIDASGLQLFDVEVHRIGSAPSPHIESVDELVQLAAALGAQNILVVGDTPNRDVVEHEVRRVVEVAADHGVGVGLEYMAWTTPHSVDEARYLAEVTGCSLVVDLLHHTRLGATVEDVSSIVADGVLGWVQICDAGDVVPRGTEALIHEARHARRPPGSGGLALDDLLAVVPASTTFSIEVQSDELLACDAVERAQLLTSTARAVLLRAFSR